MSAAADILAGLGPALGALPVVGPWLSVLCTLGASLARAGGTPQHVSRIDAAALAAERLPADARLDQGAEGHDRPRAYVGMPDIYPEDP